MAEYTERFSEGHAITGIIPQTLNNSAANSGWLSMRDFHRAAIIVQAGAIAGGGGVTMVVQQAKDTSGSGAKTLKSATALTGTDDNGIVVIEVRSEELDVDNRYDCIRLLLTETGTQNAVLSALVLRYVTRFAPVDVSALHQVVA